MSDVTECINCGWKAANGQTHDEYVAANRMTAWLCDRNAVHAHEAPADPMPPRPRDASPLRDDNGTVIGYAPVEEH